MQFLASLFGGAENSILTAFLALVVVIALILLVLWVMKVMFKATGTVGRTRNRRLSVVDQLSLDPKRQLLILRRDNVEHLVLIGGPQDVLIEANIPVEPAVPRPVPQRRQAAPAPQAAAAAHPVEPEPRASSPLDRLRDLGRPAAQRRSPSLRHTGLMRPVSRMEPAVTPANSHNSDHPHPDSAKTGASDGPSEQAIGGGDGEQRDDGR